MDVPGAGHREVLEQYGSRRLARDKGPVAPDFRVGVRSLPVVLIVREVNRRGVYVCGRFDQTCFAA